MLNTFPNKKILDADVANILLRTRHNCIAVNNDREHVMNNSETLESPYSPSESNLINSSEDVENAVTQNDEEEVSLDQISGKILKKMKRDDNRVYDNSDSEISNLNLEAVIPEVQISEENNGVLETPPEQ